MPIVSVNLVLDDKTYAGVCAGILELGGLVKDKELKRVRKHLPIIGKQTKGGATKAVAVMKAHKGVAIKLGIGATIIGALIGLLTFFINRKKRKAEKEFSSSLHTYLNAAEKGKITTELIENLVKTLESISKNSKTLPLRISADDLFMLFSSIYDFTKRLAIANSFTSNKLKVPKKSGKNTVDELVNYLNIQKVILEKAA